MIQPGAATRVAGIGVDLLDLEKFRCLGGDLDDPFYRKTFTGPEREQASEHGDPVLMLAFSFAGKEAVFKCLGMDGNHARLNEIEVTRGTREPVVRFLGNLERVAGGKGIERTHLQLELRQGLVWALAVAIGGAPVPGSRLVRPASVV